MQRTLAVLAAAALVVACGPRPDDLPRTDARASTGSSTRVVPADKDATPVAAATGTMGAASAPRSALGDKSDDGKITGLVMSGLKADRELNALRIDVDTQGGVVTLSGSVPTAAAKAHAAEVAQNVQGVTSVNNQLTLSSS